MPLPSGYERGSLAQIRATAAPCPNDRPLAADVGCRPQAHEPDAAISATSAPMDPLPPGGVGTRA